MRYLSFDLEATGLAESDLIIEFGLIPFCTSDKNLNDELKRHWFIKCPAFEELKPNLDPWVIENNKELIENAHNSGVTMDQFKEELVTYCNSNEVKNYFGKKIILFGKSMNAIDLPFMNRDLGWDTMRELFHHQVLDLSSIVMGLVDAGKIPEDCISGSFLSNYLGIGDVAHTALEDARNMATMYLKILEKY